MARTPEIVPFTREHLDAAAALVAARQSRLRRAESALPERWTEPAQARTLVEEALARPHAAGHAALEGGQVVGFLIGELRLEPPWDRAGWVEAAGWAVDAHRPDLARDLYAAWTESLVRPMGVFRYLVNVPTGEPESLEAWYQMGFGQMHAFAIRSTDPSDLAPAAPDIRIRRATPDDVALMEATSELIWREQAGPPSWSPIAPEQVESLPAEYVSELSEEGDDIFVAEDEDSGEALGVSISYPMDPGLDVPDGAMKLASTTTFAAARRRGAGRALVHAVLRNAREKGVDWCVTDWRTSSLLASRTWTALGWRRTRVRLERRIDERVAWAADGD